MERRERICRHCHGLFIPVRNPRQQFCSQSACQNVRKSVLRREKQKNDRDYQENQNQACKRWRKKNPKYWKAYRETHPEYTEGNRSKQKKRQAMYKEALFKGAGSPCSGNASLIANSDALPPKSPVKAGRYQLIPFYGKIANSDALIVEISVIQRDYQQVG